MNLTPAIVADDQVVHSWKEAAGRSLHAAGRASDPALRATLLAMGRDGRELVAYLADALTHAGGIFLTSVANARPEVAALFAEGLAGLVDEVMAQQETDRGREIDGPCPLGDPSGGEYRCRCGPAARRACGDIAFDIGAGELPLGGFTPGSGLGWREAGDSGCEGGVR
jgi:hypothetical protein